MAAAAHSDCFLCVTNTLTYLLTTSSHLPVKWVVTVYLIYTMSSHLPVRWVVTVYLRYTNVVIFTCEVSRHSLPERYNVVTFTCEVGPSSPWVRSRDYHATLQNLSSLSADWHPSSTPPPVSLCDCTQYDNNDKNDNTVLVINYTTNLSGRVSTKELHWDKYWTPSNHTINATFQLHPMSSVHIFSLHSQPNSLLKL